MKLAAQGRARSPFTEAVLGRVAFEEVAPSLRADHVLVSDGDLDCAGYAGVLAAGDANGEHQAVVEHVGSLEHLASGDVVALHPSGYVRTLYRRGSRHNALFATDRCNSYCLMCSQPPRDADDSALIDQNLRLIELVDPELQELGITGGEPTLLKDGLLRIVEKCRDRLPQTALHILSNGRLFRYGSFARALGEIQHPDLMVGVPLYSHLNSAHDYVVQCRGAFNETVIGLQNLARFGVRVEIRVVLHALTWRDLPRIAEFIYWNVPFAAHVALMGLEVTGLAVPNLDTLWVDPWDYRDPLERSVSFLSQRGMRVSIYNHQLCTLPSSLWPFARRSISDWKNEYLPACDGCSVRDECGGFFATNLSGRHSRHISPVQGASR